MPALPNIKMPNRDGFIPIRTSTRGGLEGSLLGRPFWIELCLLEIKSGHTRDAIRRLSGGKEYALPSLRLHSL